jgi:hypothetical protein
MFNMTRHEQHNSAKSQNSQTNKHRWSPSNLHNHCLEEEYSQPCSYHPGWSKEDTVPIIHKTTVIWS